MTRSAPIRLALVQFRPHKARPEDNLARIAESVGEQTGSADLVVFPETALTGYFLEGGVSEGARAAEVVARGLGPCDPSHPDVVVGFYERWRRRLYNAVGYFEAADGGYRLRQGHRKQYLHTNGVVDEERYVENWQRVTACDNRNGRVRKLLC